MRVAALLLALAGAAPLAVAAPSPPRPGDLVSTWYLGLVEAAEIDGLVKPLFESWPVPPMRWAVDLWRVRYASADADGSPAEVIAQLFVPRLPQAEERPVLVFGSGTTGINDRCAPSLEMPEVERLGYYRENMLAYAGLGFIAVFPDYLGFNDARRPQRYFSKAAEAHVMLDAARAVARFFDEREAATGGAPAGPAAAPLVRPAAKVFVAGYSQGGHAAFAAADLGASYAPEVPLAGVMGFAATCDVATLLREGPVYAPFILYSYSLLYGPKQVDPSALLQERWARSLAADADRLCVNELQLYYPTDPAKLYRPEFQRALFGGALPQAFPFLAARLADNSSGLSGHRLPALIVQGGEDIVITTASQDRFVESLRKAGSPVRYLLYPAARHKHTRPAGFADSVAWMELVAGGAPPPVDGRGR